MNSLFGVELPTPVNFVIAFVVVLLLIGAATWLVRRFGAARIEAAARGRQPRLAVIDSAAVDGRRKLVIIRRDNIEHLLMIGGPSDVVVETNIVRATAAMSREAPAGRNGASAETQPRTIPLPEPTTWPLQPEPLTVRSERPRGNPPEELWATPAETPPPVTAAPEVRAVRPPDTLMGLAEDLARPTEMPAQRPAPAAARPPAPAPAPAPVTDQSLAEMAHRLEAALRRPTAQRVVAEGKRVTATVDINAAPPKSAAPSKGGASPKPQSSNLEQEMASLLSRPGKT